MLLLTYKANFTAVAQRKNHTERSITEDAEIPTSALTIVPNMKNATQPLAGTLWVVCEFQCFSGCFINETKTQTSAKFYLYFLPAVTAFNTEHEEPFLGRVERYSGKLRNSLTGAEVDKGG